jgi:hypothetical protein
MRGWGGGLDERRVYDDHNRNNGDLGFDDI